mmetsp:Transcript_36269/g.77281  ORF Transcript_36269/g.77281 Transcript_36269/m.77281 type:complete len:87 (+) Transcript_36269:41-301(+)
MSCPKCGPSRVMTTVCPTCKGPLGGFDTNGAHPVTTFDPSRLEQRPMGHNDDEVIEFEQRPQRGIDDDLQQKPQKAPPPKGIMAKK